MSMLYAFAMQAQEQIRVWKEGESKRFRTSELVFSEDGTSFVSAYVPVTVEADDSMNVDKDDDTGQEDAE